jgi:hypothetical protein
MGQYSLKGRRGWRITFALDSSLLLDDQVFSACNLIIIDFQGITHQEGHPAVSDRLPMPERKC